MGTREEGCVCVDVLHDTIEVEIEVEVEVTLKQLKGERKELISRLLKLEKGELVGDWRRWEVIPARVERGPSRRRRRQHKPGERKVSWEYGGMGRRAVWERRAKGKESEARLCE